MSCEGVLSRLALSALASGVLASCVEPTSVEETSQSLTSTNPYSQSFTTFESGQVRPLAFTANKKFLLATNTPDAKLEIYKVKKHGLEHVASVPVGLEPVAVAVRGNDEAWVVNHLSDSISIVALDGKHSRVTRTLLVGDEPRDIVFAGPGRSRAFITTAHRGQNSPIDPQLATPGVGRADVWVFDANSCGGDSSLGGEPLTILTFFAEMPRALAVTPDGSKVYAAAFHSGNATASTFSGNFVGIGNPLPPFAPSSTLPFNVGVNAFGQEQALTSVIVKYDGAHWRDENGFIRDGEMQFTLPDRDVFAIDANASVPAAIAGPAGVYAHVGTTLFNMIVNPANGKVYVSNLESNNQQRFEGVNAFAAHETHPDPTVRGKIAFSRITVLDAAGGVTPRHLNKHIDYSTCCAAIPNAENARSVAFPIGMEITANGQKLYVAAVGSSEVAVYDTAQLENDTFVPSTANQIHVSGGGPTGLALDEQEKRLYVLTRFDNAIKIIDTQSRTEIGSATMYNPEPAHVVTGRKFLYDASFSSSHGDSACFSCHIFGDMDHIGWDLGDPDAENTPDPNVYINNSFRKFFGSMKGVMTTQSLRGMDNQGPMHWRGDRTGAALEPSAQPSSGHFNEQLAFKAFRVAFPGLLGRNAQIPEADLQAFTNFVLEIMYPPNPIRHLDDSLTPRQQLGFDVFFGPKTFFDPLVAGDPDGAGTLACGGCHALQPDANAGLTTKPGFFGSNTLSAEVGGLANTKNPHLRNLYQKVGKFGFPVTPVWLPSPGAGLFRGEQVRGFGFAHDGSFDTTLTFSFAPNFGKGLADPAEPLTIFPPFLGVQINNPDGLSALPGGLAIHEALDDYMMVFESNFKPIVGQQVTLTDSSGSATHSRIALLLARAREDDCQVIAFASDRNTTEGFLYTGTTFRRDRAGRPALTEAQLRARANHGGTVTYTCVPKGNGIRLALDRDLDGVLNGNE
jgi:DNA-binding beta-propeller fold protein YncE